MNPVAIIWDIDGTLIDSEPLHQRALQQICDNYLVDISDLAQDHFTGVNMHMVWEALADRYPAHLDKNTWLQEINRYYCRHAPQLEEVDGAANVVRSLHDRGIRQAAVSNSCRLIVDANLQRLGLCALLEFSLSLDDVTRPKPDPFPYEHALELMGLLPSEAIAVEDSLSGGTSAKAAGIFTVGYRNDNIGADRTIKSLCDIKEFFPWDHRHGLQN